MTGAARAYDEPTAGVPRTDGAGDGERGPQAAGPATRVQGTARVAALRSGGPEPGDGHGDRLGHG